MSSLIGGSDAFTSFGGSAPAAPVGNVASWNSDTGAVNTTPAVVVADTIQNSEGVKYLTEEDVKALIDAVYEVTDGGVFGSVATFKPNNFIFDVGKVDDNDPDSKEGQFVVQGRLLAPLFIDGTTQMKTLNPIIQEHIEKLTKISSTDTSFRVQHDRVDIDGSLYLTLVDPAIGAPFSGEINVNDKFVSMLRDIQALKSSGSYDHMDINQNKAKIATLENKTAKLNSDGTFIGGVDTTSPIKSTSDVYGRYFVGHLHYDTDEIHNNDHDTSNIWSNGLNIRFNRCTSTAIGEVKYGGFSDSVQMPKTWGDSSGGGLNQMMISKNGKLKMILKRANFNAPGQPYSTVNAGYNDESFVELLSKSQNKLVDASLEIDCKTVKCVTLTATNLIGDARQLTGINTIVADLVTSYTISSDSISLKSLVDQSVGKRWEVIVKGFEGPYFQIIPPAPPNTPGILDPGGAFHRTFSPVQYANVTVRGFVRTPLERSMDGFVEPQYLPQAPQPSLGASFIRWKNHLAVSSAGVSDPTTFGDITFSWVTNEQLNGYFYPVLRMLKYLYKNITDEIVYNTGVCVRKMLTTADLATISYDQATNTILDLSKIPQLWDTAINATSTTVTNAVNNDTITRGTFQNVFIENQAGQKMRLDGTYEYEYGGSTLTKDWPIDLNYDHFGISFGAKVSTDTGEEIKFINEEINMIKATKHHLTAPLLRPSLQLNTLVTTNDIINLSGQFTLLDVPFNLYGGFQQTVIDHNGALYPALRLYQTIGETVADTLGDGFPQFQHLTNAAENKTAYITLLQNGTMLVNDVFIKRETIGGDNKYHRAITWEELPVLISLASLPDPDNDDKVPPGAVITAGDDLNIAKSPFPIAYVDSNGKLNASTLYSSKFSDQVFGVDDPDLGANRKPSPYSVGLVPGSDTLTAAERLTKYLRADGTWQTISQPDLSEGVTVTNRSNYLFKIDVDGGGGSSQPTTGISFITNDGYPVNPTSTQPTYIASQLVSGWESGEDAWKDAYIKFRTHASSSTMTTTMLMKQNKVKIGGTDTVAASEALEVVGNVKATSYKGNGSTLSFAAGLSWKHSTTNQTHTLDDVMDDIETLLPLIGEINSLPKIDPIHNANFLCITSLADGGTIANTAATTSILSEGTNLFFTNDRCDARVNARLAQQLPAITADALTAQTITANSDERLKKNIRPIARNLATKTIQDIEAASYEFKAQPDRRRYGVVAQQLLGVEPDLVHRSSNGTLSVDYMGLVPLLISSLQDAHARIARLEEVVAHSTIVME
jgi:hypothetical protein